MSELLIKLNRAGLIEKLDGNDERFNKIKTASSVLAETFKEKPPILIRAVLAGLEPDISSDDPAIEMAHKALTEQWASADSVYTDTPKNLYRSMLLEACNQVAEGNLATILWNTAADTLPLVRLGREEEVIRNLLSEWAKKAEEYSLVAPSEILGQQAAVAGKNEPKIKQVTIDRKLLLNEIAAAAGPNYKNQALADSNPHWSNQPQQWSWEFSDRMTRLLADQLDVINKIVVESQTKTMDQLQNLTIRSEKYREEEHLRLNTLWWSEALFSPSLQKSYRELPLETATVVMALDLLETVKLPTPASVSYVLLETVAKLSAATMDKEHEIVSTLKKLKEQKKEILEVLKNRMIDPPTSGRWSIRDMIVSTLTDGESDFKMICKKAGLNSNHKLSLPRLAQILFRQEQAVLLAEAK